MSSLKAKILTNLTVEQLLPAFQKDLESPTEIRKSLF